MSDRISTPPIGLRATYPRELQGNYRGYSKFGPSKPVLALEGDVVHLFTQCCILGHLDRVP